MKKVVHYRHGKWNKDVAHDVEHQSEEEPSFIDQIHEIIKDLKQ